MQIGSLKRWARPGSDALATDARGDEEKWQSVSQAQADFFASS